MNSRDKTASWTKTRTETSLQKAKLRIARRHGEERFDTPYKGISLIQLQSNMRRAIKESGLSLAQIAERMGFDMRGSNPRREVFDLVHYVKDSGLFTVLRFCDAVGIPLEKLLPPRKGMK